MTRLEYSPAALEKLGAIHRYITEELKNPNGAANTIRAIREKIRGIKKTPMIGAPLMSRCAEVPQRFQNVRILLCGHYLAVYLYDGKTVKILQIYHTAEDYVRHLFEMYRGQSDI
jgi:plasmid stabilization system protein ParE